MHVLRAPVRLALIAALCCAVLLLVVLLQLRAMLLAIEVYDEGLALYGAARIARGAIPYRDFWSLYLPGSFYALAGLDRIFGESVFVGRCLDALNRASIVLLVFAVVRRRAGPVGGVACAMTVCALLVGGPGMLVATLPATAASLMAMLFLDHALEFGHASDVRPIAAKYAWIGAGSAAGVTLAFRQDLGMYVTLVCLGTIAATSEVRPLNVFQTSRLRAFLFGLLLTTALPMTWLLVAVPFPDLWESLVRIPTQLYADFRSLPLPSPYEMILDKLAGTRTRPLRDLTVYLPPAIGILGAVLAAKDWMAFRRRVPSAPGVRGVPGASYDAGFAAWVALCLLFCLKGAVRTEFLHMLPALVIASVIVVMVASRLRWRTASAAVAVIVVACAAVRIDTVVRRSIELHAASMPTSLWPYAVRLAGGCGNPHGRRLGCFRLDTGSSAALDYLLANGKEGTPIYVGTGRHDKILTNNVELYFLSGMPSVTKWHDFHPGVQTSREIQLQIIRDMEVSPPAFVVLNSKFDAVEENNESRYSSGVKLLDDYLQARFKTVLTSGSYTVAIPDAMFRRDP